METPWNHWLGRTNELPDCGIRFCVEGVEDTTARSWPIFDRASALNAKMWLDRTVALREHYDFPLSESERATVEKVRAKIQTILDSKEQT